MTKIAYSSILRIFEELFLVCAASAKYFHIFPLLDTQNQFFKGTEYKAIILRFWTILLLLFLTSCSSTTVVSKKGFNKEPVRPILANLEQAISKKYQVKHPNVILFYNLGAANSNTLAHNHYANTINSSNVSKQFINSFKINKAQIKTDSRSKIYKIQDLLRNLQKNKIYISPPKVNSDPFGELAKFHNKTAKFLPILTPAHLPRLTSHYGSRRHQVTGAKKFHYGLDLVSSKKLIFAAAEGVVHSAGVNTGYGNNVVIDHHNGFKTLYAHLEHILVSKNQKVLQGELIGIEGRTGQVTGIHLHFETIYQGQKINPATFVLPSLQTP
jgi:murein DD-endopeptidase MepM/ murein hydrolase activator NlpD